MLNNNQSVHTCRENGVYKLKRKLNKDIFNEHVFSVTLAQCRPLMNP
jgi:hypothetical protein